MRLRLLTPCLLLCSLTAPGQSIGTFTSVQPIGQNSVMSLPSTHDFQVFFQTGNAIPGISSVKSGQDFTCYVPVGGSSVSGYLSLNHEQTPGAVSQMNCILNTGTQLWSVSGASEVDFSSVVQTTRPCSGGITPWGTVVSAEETFNSGDANSDGYQDVGWLVETNPATHTLIHKIWAAGRCAHENACFHGDSKTLYTGADDGTNGFLYKFVATTAGDLSAGTLYALQRNGSTGTWLTIANTSKAEQNGTQAAAAAAGATNFNGIEDVEIGNLDGKIYFAAKGPGVVYRFTDDGTTISGFETFIASVNYTINWQNGASGGSTSVAWGTGNDNLAFDGEGNLWVLQDGGSNYVWMVKPTHTAGSPQVSLFMTTPSGSEPTGITFTPDYKYMFLSFQHPGSGNTGTLTDAAGQSITFNKGTTLVVARAEYLGALLTLELTDFQAIADGNGNILLEWTVAFSETGNQVEVQFSPDGRLFSTLKTLDGDMQAGIFSEKICAAGAGCHYLRLKFTEADGQVTFSPVRVVCLGMEDGVRIFPNPVEGGQGAWVECDFEVENAALFNSQGEQIFVKTFAEPVQKFLLDSEIAALPQGIYFLELRGENRRAFAKFIRA